MTSCCVRHSYIGSSRSPRDCLYVPSTRSRATPRNNWHRMHAAHFKAMEVDWVSARAEAQVRERTRRRFEGPGAWSSQKNLEGKATLRAIIDEGSWEPFRQWCG